MDSAFAESAKDTLSVLNETRYAQGAALTMTRQMETHRRHEQSGSHRARLGGHKRLTATRARQLGNLSIREPRSSRG